MSEDPDGSTLKALGWRQFSAVPEGVRQALVQDSGLDLGPSDVLMIASHDCDVTHWSLSSEPTVEVLVARRKEGEVEDGALTYAKNPRRLQFRCPEPSGSLYELNAHERRFIKRAVLLEHAPDPEWKPTRRLKRTIAGWLARRYVRPAFPDAFNQRIPSKCWSGMRRTMKSKGSMITDAHVFLSPDEELPVDEPYRLVLVMTMTSDDFNQQPLKNQADDVLAAAVDALRSCNGIVVEDAYVASEADFSLEDVRLTKLLDFEDLSLR